MMSAEEKFSIVRSVGEECIQEHELLKLLTNKRQPICYDGFEPSGRMHIAQGVMKTINVNKLISAGCKFKIWIADWFAFLNNKMDADLEKIQIVGRYFIEIWKAAGMNIEGGQVEFLWASEEIISRAHEYWPIVMDIARRNKLHMLPGLKKGQEKMSKSDPSNAIFMEDEEADVIQKIDNAYCPPKVVDKNPCLEYINYIVFPWFNEFKVERNAENGGEKTFTSFDELVADYEKGDVQPADLKPALSKALNRILQPVRDHFKTDENAKALFERVKVWTFSSSLYFFTNSLYLLHTVFVLFCRVLKSQNDQNRVVVLSTSTSESAISSRLDEFEP
ncbi:putative tyrosine--tRNA ligase [Helianthus annuus]|uniref:tyrosine--tRNA ligase n=1 Tax=Helianthus annuus TaxID=4232 RepID=A0A251SPD4_HELAN|nr:putative tyrosine--tRNA ligase [Helianthus annuus]KAJ0479937.1 putative tyrosine--tRNA ligase [Helianthus annuus]KAJ0496709.1 putative tyrosine--tRNA ligase [Helianthus annuus]KAJ0848120.1 putative tyrosine--tRNA ligase [Helianthus annuus]KAJ0857068.1 putative tyrosine--tRNA ligase [Helianthus annuus]